MLKTPILCKVGGLNNAGLRGLPLGFALGIFYPLGLFYREAFVADGLCFGWEGENFCRAVFLVIRKA